MLQPHKYCMLRHPFDFSQGATMQELLCWSLVYSLGIRYMNSPGPIQFSLVSFHSQLKICKIIRQQVSSCSSFIFMLLTLRWGSVYYPWEEMPSDSWDLREAGEKGRSCWLILHSSAMVRIWACRECRLHHSYAVSNFSYTEVNRVSRESYICTDQGRLSKPGSRTCIPTKVVFLEMLFLSRSLKSTFFLNSLHPSVALGTLIFPAPQQERSMFLASDFMDGCREAVKCSWQINPERGKRLLSFFLFFLIQLLSDLYHLNNSICSCFYRLWSWVVIAL